MRARPAFLTGFTLLALAYLASPYVALWQLESALDRGDTQALERGVDWASVREGLKQDIADGIIGPVQQQITTNTLPPFGASFITGIADTAVEREVTPQNLVAVMRQMRAPHPPGMDSASNAHAEFRWAFFESPTSFGITLRTPDQDADDLPLRLRLELRRGRWTLVRAWIPQDMVERSAQRT